MANMELTSTYNSAELLPSWNVIYLIESFLICFGNSLSIIVFWRRRHSLRRTSYLLINLAVADLGLGVFTTAEVILVQLWPRNLTISHTLLVITLLPMFASIFSLTLISLETVYAMVFPFRHRTTGRRTYYFALTLTWILATLHSVMWIILPLYNVAFFFPLGCIAVVIFGVCLILLSTSYLLIWCFVSKGPNRQMREGDQRKKLSITLFVVTVLSLMTWIPGQLAFIGNVVEASHFADASAILVAVLLANSFLNPLVYTFRMPEFRREIKLIICKLPWCTFKLRADAPSSTAPHIISTPNIHSAHEMGVLRSPCDPQERNDNNANQLRFQGDSLNP